jgi:two-component sensor histidine kinase/CheY-like chemotaxis protein
MGFEPGAFELTLPNLRQLVMESDFERIQRMLRSLTPENQTCQLEFRVRRSDGEIGWLLGTAGATIDGERGIVRISGVTIDITERKKAEERQTLLAREVDHRAKNALAVVQSIIRLSRGEAIASYRDAIEGRINALARAHTLLAASRWDGADLKRIVDEELAPYMTEEGRIQISGPTVMLAPGRAQALAMTIHELITNAVKYGALAAPSGRLGLEWRRDGPRLAVAWVESGVADVRAPEAVGFGLRVINASVTGQLSGTLDIQWLAHGLRCEMVMPLDGQQPAAVPQSPAPRQQKPPAANADRDQPRVLLAEDETLVAMMMQDLLHRLGFEVDGPFRTVSEAVEAARTRRVTAAILDISLGNERIYPVADVLASRGVPFAFVTGYGSEAIDRRYANEYHLQKPVSIESLTQFLSKSARSQASRGKLAS